MVSVLIFQILSKLSMVNMKIKITTNEICIKLNYNWYLHKLITDWHNHFKTALIPQMFLNQCSKLISFDLDCFSKKKNILILIVISCSCVHLNQISMGLLWVVYAIKNILLENRDGVKLVRSNICRAPLHWFRWMLTTLYLLFQTCLTFLSNKVFSVFPALLALHLSYIDS